MTREELDELGARDPLFICRDEALALIAQARRAIELEEQLREAGKTFCGKFVDEGMCARELGHTGDCRRTR